MNVTIININPRHQVFTVTLAPLASAPVVIQVHVVAALLALASGTVVLVLRKGTGLHWRIGWVFALAMAATALSSLFIMRNGQFSAIHLLTVLTMIALPYAIVMRRRGHISAHRTGMVSLFIGLVIAGAFTLVPGRLMHKIVLTAPVVALR